MPIKTYAAAINEALDQCLSEDSSVLLVGEGVPHGVFGITKSLKDKHESRVFDSPISESGVTGAVVGASLSGARPILMHQRADFSLLAIDPISSAAKWYSTFGRPCPIVVCMVVGRGWGQGNNHSQSLQSLYATFSGLKIVMPSSPADAKGVMVEAIRDNNPVIVLFHRWLLDTVGEVPFEAYSLPLDKSKVLREGGDVTVVALSYSNIEALKAVELLKPYSIRPEVIDLRCCHHIDLETIGASVRKTGRLLVVETTRPYASIGAEVVRAVTERYFNVLKAAPKVIGTKDYPCPTSHFLTEDYYADDVDVANECLKLCGSPHRIEKQPKKNHDVPDSSFKGPF